MKVIRKYCFCLAAILFTPSSLLASTNDAWNPYLGRILLSGTASKEGIFGADGMLPIYGNQDGFAFTDLMGDYATDNSFLVSPGGGYRKAFGNQIMGAYFFGDYEKVNLGPKFWDLSPGIEWMNSRWDAHFNAYFPTTKSKRSGPADFADNLGDNSQVSFKSGTHNQYDAIVQPYAVIGNGADVEIGYSLPGMKNLRSRAYIGAYYYGPSGSASSFTGITAGFQEPLDQNLSVAIENSYDKVSDYTIGLSLTLSLGGNSHILSNDVDDRLLDPIERHIGIIGTGAGTYAQQNLKTVANGVLEYNNVYFISPNGSSALTHGIGLADPADLGAYGSPATLDQATLDQINALSPNGARIYLQGGSAAVYNINSTTAPSGSLTVYNGQDFYGRSADYKSLASSDESPEILVANDGTTAAFSASNTTENTFSNLYLDDPSQTANGIDINNNLNQTVNILNTRISGFSYGINSSNTAGSQTINLTNSSIETAENDGWHALNSDGSLAININNSILSNNTGAGVSLVTSGGSTTADITNSLFSSNADGFLDTNSNASSFNMTVANSEFNNENANGLYVFNASNSTGNINLSMTNSQFDNDTNGLRITNGNRANGNITVSAMNSEFNTNSANGLLVTNLGHGLVDVTSLVGSRFNNNGAYGISGMAASSDVTTIHYTGASFSGNGTADTSEHSGDKINWID